MDDPLDRLKQALTERYIVERELGRGGMATVYLAHDLKHDREVAIKVLRPELAATLGAERFVREIEIAAKLTHPHILPLYDSGEADGFLYYVMPYVEGESLRDRLHRERQLPLEDAIRIAREVASALSNAHSLGVIHRDIKPENILLSAGEAVVADFGIARAVTAAGGEQLTETGMAVGTPAYMSPEQATAGEMDGRSDIYSLGCVLYEMLGGEPPYTGATPKAVLARKLTDPVPSLRALRETVQAGLEQAAQKALAKAPADRFQTAGAFADALVTASMATTEAPVAKPHAWQPSRVGMVALLLLVIVVGGWWVVDRIISRGNRIERLVVLPPANLMRDSTQDYFIDGIHDELIAKLSPIAGLDVISRTSAVRYRDTEKTTPEIAQELDVDAVLESSVLRSGDSVRIQVQLIDALPRERHLWQHTYNEPYRDILSLHSQVALDVAEQIHISLRPEQQAQLANTHTVNPVAHEALSRARLLVHSLEPGRAIPLIEQAIATDSGYADAYAWLAWAYDAAGGWFGDLAPSEGYPLALNAVEKALALDSASSLAHAALGNIRFRFLWDWTGAEAAYLKALHLDPGSADAHEEYSNYLRAMGRLEEGLIHAERAVELDPFYVVAVAEAAYFYHWTDRHEMAEAKMRRALELEPDLPGLYWMLGEWRFETGDLDGAIEMFEREGVPGTPLVDSYRAVVYATKGDDAKARMLLDSVQQRQYLEHLGIAGTYAALGEDSTALDWLERAYRAREPMLVWLRNIVSEEWLPLSRLRTHPRFQAVLEQMNFPASATRQR
jgi:serine/threonine-protein kinase